MAYELLDRTGLTKVVGEISAKVKASLGDTKPITLIESGSGDSASQKFYFNSTTNDLIARPTWKTLHLPFAQLGPTVNLVRWNVGTKYYDEPSYLSLDNSYEEELEYLAVGTRSGAGPYGTAFGSNAEAWNDYSVAVGTRAFCGASDFSNYQEHFGDLMPVAREEFRRTGSTAVGALAQAGGACTAVGRSAYAWLDSATAIGAASNAGGSYSTSLGEETTAASTGSTALGSKAAASAQYATAIGYQAAVSADAYRNADQFYNEASVTSLEPTDEENLSVALGAFSTVRPGQNDVVSVGSEMQDFVRNFFNGVTAARSTDQSFAYDWNTETTERAPFYRRVVNVKDPLEDHDAATKGYVDKLVGTLPQKNDDGIYEMNSVQAWVESFDEQRFLVKMQPQLNTRPWCLTNNKYNSIFTEVSALVGDNDASSGHGVCFNRPCYVNESKQITWIRGIDQEDGTQPNYVITPALYGTVTYDSSTDAICDAKHGAITWLTIGTKKQEGDNQFQAFCLMPRYPVMPSSSWTLPVSGAQYAYASGGLATISTMSTRVLWYIQTMWLIKYSNTYAGHWMDVGVNSDGTETTLQDPTSYGGEYGEQDCMYVSWSATTLYKQFPEGYKVTVHNSTKSTYVKTEVLFASAYDDTSSILCIYLADYFTYDEGDTVSFSFTTPTDRRTGETDGWLNDGWEDASAFSGQFRQHEDDSSSARYAQISADTAVSAYRLCNIELGLGCASGLGSISLTRPDTSSWDYLEWSLTDFASKKTFKFPFYNYTTVFPSKAYATSNTIYLSCSTDGTAWLWGSARLAADYQMLSYNGVLVLPYTSSAGSTSNAYIGYSNESGSITSSPYPSPSWFHWVSNTGSLGAGYGTKYQDPIYNS